MPARSPFPNLFDLVRPAPVAALIPPPHQEPAVAFHTDFARRLAVAGFYGPFRVRDRDAVIEDRSGHPMILALQVVAPASAREAAEIATAGLNLLCGFERASTQAVPTVDAVE